MLSLPPFIKEFCQEYFGVPLSFKRILEGGRHLFYRVETLEDQKYFLKIFTGSVQVSSHLNQEFYTHLYNAHLGLKPICIHSQLNIFPFISPLKQGKLSPLLFAKSLFSLHTHPFLKIYSIDLFDKAFFYLLQAQKLLTGKRIGGRDLERKEEMLILREKLKKEQLLLGQWESELGFIHSDLSLENLIWDNNQVLFIDFEYSGRADIYFDFAAIFSFLGEVEFKVFIESYIAQRKGFCFNQEKLDFYSHLRNLVIRSWELWQEGLVGHI